MDSRSQEPDWVYSDDEPEPTDAELDEDSFLDSVERYVQAIEQGEPFCEVVTVETVEREQVAA